MIWGYDRSVDLIVKLSILVVALGVHFIRLYIKRRKNHSEDTTEVDQSNNNTTITK